MHAVVTALHIPRVFSGIVFFVKWRTDDLLSGWFSELPLLYMRICKFSDMRIKYAVCARYDVGAARNPGLGQTALSIAV